MDAAAVKRAAEQYLPQMTKFLRDLIAIPSESCEEEGVIRRTIAEMEALGAENGKVDKLDRLRLAIKYGTFTDQMYVDFLSSDTGKTGYHRFFEELLSLPDGQAILFHCSEGKDRTGCAAMLILYALGVDEKTIMEDFLLTNIYNAALIEEDRRLLAAEGISEEEMDVMRMAAREAGVIDETD